jgi:hypothetical protein
MLERYCMRDATALAELVTRAAVRVPGGGVVRMDAVVAALAGAAPAMCRAEEADGAEDGEEAAEAAGGAASAQTRPKRKRAREGAYDETKRKRARAPRPALPYVERGHRQGGAKRNAIEVGERVVDRVVAQRYEWRDGGLATRKRRSFQGGDGGRGATRARR